MSANETKLGGALRGAADKPKGSKLALAIAGARPFEPWVVPRLEIECAITLVSADVSELIEAEVWAQMAAMKLPLNTTTESSYELARAKRYAVHALVDRVTHDPIGTLAEWGDVDTDVLAAFWAAYGDLREAYDPAAGPLTEAETVLIVEAIKKKHVRLLRLFGVRRLATYLLSSDGPLVSSPKPNSGDSSLQPAILASAASDAPPGPATS